MIYCKNCENVTSVRSYEEYRRLNPETEFSRNDYYGACSLCAEDDDRFGIGLIEIDLNN